MTDQRRHNLLLYAKKEFEKLGYECCQEEKGLFVFRAKNDYSMKILVTTEEEELFYRIDVDFYWCYGGTLQDIINDITKSYKRAEENIEIVKAKMKTTDVEKEAILDTLKECGVPSGIIKAIERALEWQD